MNANDEIAIVLYVVIASVALFCLYRLIQKNNSDSLSDNTTTSKPKVTFAEDSIENPLVV